MITAIVPNSFPCGWYEKCEVRFVTARIGDDKGTKNEYRDSEVPRPGNSSHDSESIFRLSFSRAADSETRAAGPEAPAPAGESR